MEVVLYEIKLIRIKKRKDNLINKILKVFNKLGMITYQNSDEIIYQLVYRIDEDRFWFKKMINGNISEEHHMKNNFSNSIEIMEGISKRFCDFESVVGNYTVESIKSIQDNTINLSYDNHGLEELIQKVSKNIRRDNKNRLSGMLIEN